MDTQDQSQRDHSTAKTKATEQTKGVGDTFGLRKTEMEGVTNDFTDTAKNSPMTMEAKGACAENETV